MCIIGTFLITKNININKSSIQVTIQKAHNLVEKKDKCKVITTTIHDSLKERVHWKKCKGGSS